MDELGFPAHRRQGPVESQDPVQVEGKHLAHVQRLLEQPAGAGAAGGPRGPAGPLQHQQARSAPGPGRLETRHRAVGQQAHPADVFSAQPRRGALAVDPDVASLGPGQLHICVPTLRSHTLHPPPGSLPSLGQVSSPDVPGHFSISCPCSFLRPKGRSDQSPGSRGLRSHRILLPALGFHGATDAGGLAALGAQGDVHHVGLQRGPIALGLGRGQRAVQGYLREGGLGGGPAPVRPLARAPSVRGRGAPHLAHQEAQVDGAGRTQQEVPPGPGAPAAPEFPHPRDAQGGEEPVYELPWLVRTAHF